MSTPPAGAPGSAPASTPGSAPAGAPAGGRPTHEGHDVVRGQVVSSAPPPAEAADVIAQAVLAVPGVAGLHAGAFGTVATYLPGRRVAGVAVRTGADGRESVEVAVVARAVRGLATDLQALSGRVRAAVSPLVPGTVDVTIADLAVDAVDA